jgi:hypothetical protein
VRGSLEEMPFEVESAWTSGWDFTVVFDDALVGGLEGELEDFQANLVASEGIEAVLHEDREVFHLRVEGLDALAATKRVNEAIERAGFGYGG